MLLSRVADALYWISRYLERAEHTARADRRAPRPRSRTGAAIDRHGLSSALYRAACGMPRTSRRQTPGRARSTRRSSTRRNRNSVAACVTARARERAAGARGDQLRHVGAAERPVPRGCSRCTATTSAARGRTTLSPHRHRRRAPVPGHHRRDDGPRRRLALPAGRPLPRARRARPPRCSTAFLATAPGRRRRAGSNHVELGRRCCGRARRSKRYCRHYTADVRPERVAEFLLLNAEFPRSVRFAADAARSRAARDRAAQRPARRRPGRAVAGRLHASLDYGQVDEILGDDPHAYLAGISRQCAQIHAALYQSYIAYPIESALPA